VLRQTALSQSDNLVLFGTVTNRDKNVLENIDVMLSFDSNGGYITKTDSFGKYYFNVPKDKTNAKLELIFRQNTRADSIKYVRNIKDTCCIKFDKFYLKYFPTRHKLDSTYHLVKLDSLKINTELSFWGDETRLPFVVFKKNSIEVDSTPLNPHHSIIDIYSIQYLVCILNDNPTMMIEIAGKSSYDENNKLVLSENRANFIKTKLVQSGINPRRIKTVAFADKKMMVKENVIQKEKDLKRKLQFLEHNRRCYARIIGWDFEN
jgi:hypothetical protein